MSKRLSINDRKPSTQLKISTNPKIPDNQENPSSPSLIQQQTKPLKEQTVIQPPPQTHQEIPNQQTSLQSLHQLQQASQEVKHTKAALLVSSISENVKQDIITAKVQVHPQTKEISQIIKKKKNKLTLEKNASLTLTQSQIIDVEYKNLLRKKQDILSQLRQVEQTQNQIRKNIHDSTLQSSRKKLNKMPTLTEQDRKHWHKIKQIVRQHEENSKLIKQINKKKEEKQLIMQNELQQRKKRQQSEEKRKTIENNIMEIKKRQNQRSQQVKQSQTLIEKLKNKTKLYQKMEENWQKIEHQLKSENQAAFFDYQNRKSINLREIKKYEEEYDAKIQQEEQKRIKKLKQSKITHPKQTFDKTKFSVDILQQAKRKKEIQQEKVHQLKQLFNKRNEYATNIKQKHKSVSKLEKINQKSKQKQNGKPTEEKKLNQRMRSMTALDIRNKGNEYMRSINSGLKVKSHSKNDALNKKDSQQQKHTYKNYLPQVMKRSEKNEENKLSDMQMLHSIINKQKVSTQEKFHEVQRITKKMENKGTQKQLLNSINAKIQMLNRLSLNNRQ